MERLEEMVELELKEKTELMLHKTNQERMHKMVAMVSTYQYIDIYTNTYSYANGV